MAFQYELLGDIRRPIITWAVPEAGDSWLEEVVEISFPAALRSTER
jgi:hypothetical protein